jgi:hypothetical protein
MAGESIVNVNEDSHEELVFLLERYKNFGVLGRLEEGEMLPCDYADMDLYSKLEKLFFKDTIIQTINSAGSGRLSLAHYEKIDINSIFSLEYLSDIAKEYLTLTEVASLADISIGSVRNATNPKTGDLKTQKIDGELVIPVSNASKWLKNRNAYKPTIDLVSMSSEEYKKEFYQVPCASDGTYFNESCRMTNGFKVGGKGEEQTFHNFEDALKTLTQMDHAKWRRPNKSGNYGIVSAVQWRNEFKHIVLEK